MKTIIFTLLALSLASRPAAARTEDFDRHFERKSLRIDFVLSGNRDTQQAAVLRLREEPVWGGPMRNLVDTFGYGGHYIYIYDANDGELIYSRGFNTLFEEWRSTEQAENETQAWNNSICIPYPKHPIRIEIAARDKADMRFHPLLSQTIDPQSIFIDRGKLKEHPVSPLMLNGDPARKVDLVFLAEGYTAKEQEKFLADAGRFTEALFSTPPFSERKQDFNVRAVGLVSEESGTDIPGKGVFRNTALHSGFYTFGIDRYLTTPDMKSVRDAVWNVPCDAIFILVNTDAYGGGGMYNFYACGTADHPQTPSVFVHELGHSFAGLADEYFTSEVTYQDFYNLEQEPWEPNITTLVRFGSKWETLLPPGTPVPTPLESPYKDKAGVFEGGGYSAKGVYRPMDHCMMRDYAPFCPACTRAIHNMIDFLTD